MRRKVADSQLYMWRGNRALYLERHLFYASQIRKRVFEQFRNIDEEAETFGEEEYERLINRPCGEDEADDLAAIAEHAQDVSVSFYLMLDDLRKRTMLGAVAGMYHQWEKELRDFIEGELRQTLPGARAEQLAWGNASIDRILDLLEEFEWPVREQTWFLTLDACRLVVNVYKHGKGTSLDQLATKYPVYLRSPLDEIVPDDLRDPNYQYLAATEQQFVEMAAAIERFWREFPERLYAPTALLHSKKV